MKKTFLLTLFVCLINNAIAQSLPVPDHVIILVEENYGFDDIYGSSYAPHLNALIGQPNVALFTSSFALTHPSQPNYLMLYFDKVLKEFITFWVAVVN